MAPKTMKTKASLKIIEDAPLEKKPSGRGKREVPPMDFEEFEITPAEKVKLGRRGKAKDINYSDSGKDNDAVSKPRVNAKTKKAAESNGKNVEPEVEKKDKNKRGKKAPKAEESDLIDTQKKTSNKQGKKAPKAEVNDHSDNDNESDYNEAPTKGKKKEISIIHNDDAPKKSKKVKATKGSKKMNVDVKPSINGKKQPSENDEDSDEMNVAEIKADKKSTKGKKRPKKDAPKKKDIIEDEGSEKSEKQDDVDEEFDIDQEPPLKKGKKTKSAPSAKAPAKNKSVTSYEDIDFSNGSKDAEGNPWNMKISCWNVDGIRAWLNKGGLDFIKYEKPDIFCIQETKCANEKLPEELTSIPGYHDYWLSGEKDGYAGVGLYTNKMAISIQNGLKDPELDDEGRIITAEFRHFYLVCTYVPNAGRKLVTLPKRLKWNEAFQKHVKALDEKKPVIICGDMNVAHNEIDLKNPKTNRKNAGFTDEERAGMTALLSDGFVDTFRHLYPGKTDAFTFWTYMMNSRAKNTGWRLDYFLVSERLLDNVCDNVIRSEVYGSDHCPITLFLHFKTLPRLPSEE